MLSPDRHITRALRLTGLGLWYEAMLRAFWPFATLILFGAAALIWGGIAVIPAPMLIWVMGGYIAALLVAILWGGRQFRRPPVDAARERIDATIAGRPLAALQDHPATTGAAGLWQAHLVQMTEKARLARPVAPDADLARRDPLALRLVGLTALSTALIFGGADRMGEGWSAIASSLRPLTVFEKQTVTGPGWEGWATPPAYMRRPVIYLNKVAEGAALDLPKGTTIALRLYGKTTKMSQDVGRMSDSPQDAPEFVVDHDGVIEIADRRFVINVQPDDPPMVTSGPVPERRADGRMIMTYAAQDDHGVVSGQAIIELDLTRVDRRFGLIPPPETRPDVILPLVMPAWQDLRDIRGPLRADLAQHPWANLPVTLRFEVMDGLEQVGKSQIMLFDLPGRRFFDTFAAALIEQRRDLLWSRDNLPRVAEILRAIIWQPEGFVDDPLRGDLTQVIEMIEAPDISDEIRDEIAQKLWDAAILLEDGGLTDALDQMKQAQERLSQAIRNGASADEIQDLMADLKSATNAYTDLLAEQGQDPGPQFGPPPVTQQITGGQIQSMMDEIERLMTEGRMAEAQELLDQFNRMMDNLQVTQNQQDSMGSTPSDRLAQTLREQKTLSDEAFRQLQDQWLQDPMDGEDQANNLADWQRGLREELGQQRGLLPGRGTPQGDQAGKLLDEAGRAMEGAEQALRQGDQAEAMARQAEAIEAMRDGIRALAGTGQDGLGDQPGNQNPASPGQGLTPQGQPGQQPSQDPLGRAIGGQGGAITTGDALDDEVDDPARARDLQDEIRRRAGQTERPRAERDYLGRLLDRF